MSPVVRVATRPAEAVPLVPWRVRLRLDELVLAARLAGDVPLPVRVDTDGGHRLSDRLSGTPLSQARSLLAASLARVDDDGPSGARASLQDQELLDGDDVDPAVASALVVLATGPLGLQLDVAVERAAGTSRLRCWFGVAPGMVVQLSTGDGLDYELAWFDPALWVSQLTRAVTVEPWASSTAPMALPDYVSLPSELLAGSEKAHDEQRTDLVPAMAAAHVGRVRLGEPGHVHEADLEEVLALLGTLGRACRGRLRLLALRRDRAEDPAVLSWLLFDDGWHELRPGRDATSVLRRRDARDVGLFSLPAVDAVARPAAGAGEER